MVGDNIYVALYREVLPGRCRGLEGVHNVCAKGNSSTTLVEISRCPHGERRTLLEGLGELVTIISIAGMSDFHRSRAIPIPSNSKALLHQIIVVDSEVCWLCWKCFEGGPPEGGTVSCR